MKTDLISIVHQIPSAKVVSYWQVAEQLCLQYGYTTSGWLVWRLLSQMSVEECAVFPWQRVINKQWIISTLKLGEKWLIQIALLKGEWVEVNNGVVDMKKYWFYFT